MFSFGDFGSPPFRSGLAIPNKFWFSSTHARRISYLFFFFPPTSLQIKTFFPFLRRCSFRVVVILFSSHPRSVVLLLRRENLRLTTIFTPMIDLFLWSAIPPTPHLEQVPPAVECSDFFSLFLREIETPVCCHSHNRAELFLSSNPSCVSATFPLPQAIPPGLSRAPIRRMTPCSARNNEYSSFPSPDGTFLILHSAP